MAELRVRFARALAKRPTTSSIATTSSRGRTTGRSGSTSVAPVRACSPRRRREAHWALQTDGVTFTVYGDEEEGIERVWPLDLLPRIIPGRRVGADRGGPEAARARAQRVPARPLRPAARAARRRRARRADLPRQGLPPRDPGHRAAARHLHPHLRHRPGARRRRPLPRARGQPAHAVGRLVHDREPHRRAAHVAGVLLAVPRAARRALPVAAAAEALRELSPRGKRRRGRRAADARHLQLGLLRAHLPRARDGRRAGRGTRSRHRERRRLPEDDARPAARRRALPPHRRRLSSTRSASGPTRRSASPASINAWRDGNVAIVNAPGTGIADDKAVYPYVPGPDPLLPRRSADPRQRAHLSHDDRRGARLRARPPRQRRGEGGLRVGRLRDADGAVVDASDCAPSSRSASRTTRAATSRSR